MAFATLASPYINPNLSHAPFANPRDDDFSLYFSIIRENVLPELGNSALKRSLLRLSSGKKRKDDWEIDIFTAEKYFSGGMDGGSDLTAERSGNKLEEAGAKRRSVTGSTCSESSGNSQSTLLRDRHRFPTPPIKQNFARRKGFLSVFRCSCSGKKAVDVDGDVAGDSNSSNSRKKDRCDDGEVEFQVKGEMDCQRTDRKKELPLPNSNPVTGKVTVGSDFGYPFLQKDDMGSSRRRSLTMLNSAAGAGTGAGGEREDDLGSESSSDLFEIESLSIKSHPFFRTEGTESTCYEPSEASIEWSVNTASAVNFSTASDFNSNDDRRSTQGREAKKPSRQHRPGLLMACVSEKAVEARAGSDRRCLPPAARYHLESRRRPQLKP